MAISIRAPGTTLLPVSVLTGFLGSGKTTLLNKLLQQPGLADTAVLINEFGEIGIDHMLVEKVDDEVVVLNSGCVCCSVRSDLVTALRDLWFKRVRGDIPEFRRVLIETTGLADPAPILHTLMTDPLVSARYRMDGVITTVDAVNGLHQLDVQPESVKQAAVADRLILTKSDIATPAQIEELTARLQALNPAAPLIVAVNGQVDAEALLNAGLFNAGDKHPDVARWLREESYQNACNPYQKKGDKPAHSHDINRHDERISSFVLTFDQPVVWDQFIDALEMLVAGQGDNLLRLKGLINVAGQDTPVVVHGVQHVFHPPVTLDHWPDADHRTRLVFITRDLGRDAVAGLFEQVLAA